MNPPHTTTAPTSTRPAPSANANSTLARALDESGFTRAQFWALMIILAGMFFDTLEQNSVGAMGSLLKSSLHIGNGELTTINTFTVIGGLIGRFAGGWIADRYGRRASLSVNLLIYTLGGLLSAITPGYGFLLVSRLIVGIGLGGEFTIGIAMLCEMVATRHRGTLVATLNIGSGGVGNFLSYGLFLLLLGPLAPALGGNQVVWRWTFVLLSLPALIVVAYRRRLPETPRFLLSQGRVEEANLSLARLTGTTLDPRHAPASRPVLSSADIPARQLKASPAAVFDRSVLSRTITIGTASWMAFGAQVTLNFLMPTLLTERGYSLSASLLYTMIMNVGSLLGACASALLAGRHGRRIVVGTAGALGCLTAVAFAVFAHQTAAILVIGALFQFFTMITNTTLAAWSPELYPTSIRASGTSIVNGIGNIAGAVMPYAAVALYGHFSFAGVFGMVAVMYAALVIASRFAPETRGRTLEEANDLIIPDTGPVPTPA